MNTPKDEMLYYAYRYLNYCDMLITQCDSWLSEEEGMKNMEKSIIERERTKRKETWKSLKRKYLGKFGFLFNNKYSKFIKSNV
jgi:hypothetical protein